MALSSETKPDAVILMKGAKVGANMEKIALYANGEYIQGVHLIMCFFLKTL